ncbi:Eisosome component PIL1-domain-containing protein [Flammula alnicola]|nr:Eisosome component PIL1-domain-containing protein [Flammula alnicola]
MPAQSAINASPLAGHMPSSLQQRPSSPDAATQPSANEAAAHGGAKSHTLESLQYQFRTFQQQYSTTSPIQKIITTEKGVAIDFDSVSRNAKSQSKELYTWGQTEVEDLRDVTDRLAYLNFVQGSLASSLATKLDGARAPLKALRDAENTLLPRRNIRAGIRNQIARLEHEQQKGNERKIADLREQLRKAESDDQQLEREVELLKRKGVRESEQLKWEAIREYGEKLVLLSQAVSPIIAVLPSVPPTPATPYGGAQTTGAIRASLQRALDNYKTGHINLPPQIAASDLSRSDTRSFGESHASELSTIHSEAPTHSATQTSPPLSSQPLSYSPVPPSSTITGSPPINPQALNHSPAPIPSLSPAPVPAVAPAPVSTSLLTTSIPAITPTVAETGVPLAAGPAGPGPASGSLHDIKGASNTAGPRSAGLPATEPQAQTYGQSPVAPAAVPVATHESAEEEKRRLAASYSQSATVPATVPSASTATQPPSQHDTAEEEKKRLEREERERILRSGFNPPGVPPKDSKDEDLPPYQEPGL